MSSGTPELDFIAQFRKMVRRCEEQADAARREAGNSGFYEDEALAALRGARTGRTSLRRLISLSLEGGGGTVPRYPKWQFELAVLPYVPVILKAILRLTTWNAYWFFVHPDELLGISPLNALRLGQHQQALQAAIAANEDY